MIFKFCSNDKKKEKPNQLKQEILIKTQKLKQIKESLAAKAAQSGRVHPGESVYRHANVNDYYEMNQLNMYQVVGNLQPPSADVAGATPEFATQESDHLPLTDEITKQNFPIKNSTDGYQ